MLKKFGIATLIVTLIGLHGDAEDELTKTPVKQTAPADEKAIPLPASTTEDPPLRLSACEQVDKLSDDELLQHIAQEKPFKLSVRKDWPFETYLYNMGLIQCACARNLDLSLMISKITAPIEWDTVHPQINHDHAMNQIQAFSFIGLNRNEPAKVREFLVPYLDPETAEKFANNIFQGKDGSQLRTRDFYTTRVIGMAAQGLAYSGQFDNELFRTALAKSKTSATEAIQLDRASALKWAKCVNDAVVDKTLALVYQMFEKDDAETLNFMQPYIIAYD